MDDGTAFTAHTKPTTARALTPDDVKRHNRAAIIRRLNAEGPATKRDLAQALGLSLPTVTQNLRDLAADGVVRRDGELASTGGRRAGTYAFDPRCRTAIGAELGATALTMVAVDMNGDVTDARSRVMRLRDDAAYAQRAADAIGDFADALRRPVAGVGVAVPATVMDASPAPIMPAALVQALRQRRPANAVRAPIADAEAELWRDRTLTDALCVYLDRRPSGALIVDGRVHPTGGRIEHMTLVPGGRECRCGRRGCMDAYCSLETLPEDYESIPGFFSVLEQGETHHRERMSQWLDSLALAIGNARSVVPGDVIVGGEAAGYLDERDLAALRERVAGNGGADGGFRLRAAARIEHGTTVGAALPFVRAAMADLEGATGEASPNPADPTPPSTMKV
ncbi:ROK family transcriptional regulator [Bifidobacterium avesanii]|nr:ROK family transcriptional regulator [Bifidobacterium avesanii]KAB8289769.1 NagC family transcriptional regulator [Bifidobacterium avesanii]